MPGQEHTPDQVQKCLHAIADTLDTYDDMLIKLSETVSVGTLEELFQAGVLPAQRQMQQTVRNWAEDVTADDPWAETAFVYLSERMVGDLPNVV